MTQPLATVHGNDEGLRAPGVANNGGGVRPAPAVPA